MKITIFGLTLSSSWGNGHATPYRAILRALYRMGHKVAFYEKDVPYCSKRRDFHDCDFCDLVLYDDWSTIRERALGEAGESDVVINASYCPEGARIIDETFQVGDALRVFYDLDTPITLENLTHTDFDYLRADQIPHFDQYLSFTGGSILEELESKWHAQKARPLYGCVDPDTHSRVAPREEFVCTLSYMGTYSRDREEKFNRLFLTPAVHHPREQFCLAGSMYKWGTQWPENVRWFEHLPPADHPAFYSSSRFTLNITREGMARTGYCPSGRFFEAAACGTPIISDWFEGLDHFFTPGEEILLANDTKDVVRALATPESRAEKIAERARERTLYEHTGERRAQELLAYLEETFSGTKQRSAEVA